MRRMKRCICLVLAFVLTLGSLPVEMVFVHAGASEEIAEQTETMEEETQAPAEPVDTIPGETISETTWEASENTGEISREAYDAVDALFAQIEAAENVTATKNADQSKITDAAIAVVQGSELYVEGSMERKGDKFSWWTTEGIRCIYDPKMRQIGETLSDTGNDRVVNEWIPTKGGTNSTSEVFLIGPFYGYDDNFTGQYMETAENIATALGDASGYTLYSGTSATVDRVAYAVSNGAVVLVDTHGTTDYQYGDDSVTGAENSYICLKSTSGLTQEDYADGAGYDGISVQINGQTIANHMTKSSPSGLVWLASCLGMATDTICTPLRNNGVEVVYGYSQSITFAGDYCFSQTFWEEMLQGETVKSSVATMKNTWGNWDMSDPIAMYYGYSNGYSTISEARADYMAFPVVVSDEDVYPGQRSAYSYGACSLQTVKSTYALTIDPVGAPEQSYYDRLRTYIRNNGECDDSGIWYLGGTESQGAVSSVYILENHDSYFLLEIIMMENANPNRLVANQLKLSWVDDTPEVEFFIAAMENDEISQFDEVSTTISRSGLTRDGFIDVGNATGNSVDWICEYFNATLQLMLGYWDHYLRCNLNYGLSEMGFYNYVSAYQNTTQESGVPAGLYYSLQDGEIAITGYEGTATTLTIPGIIRGYPVTSIDNMAFFDCPTLETVIVPDNVVRIGAYAFYGCSNLTGLLLPAKLSRIDRYAFYGIASDANVLYKGTKAQRDSIAAETDNVFSVNWHYSVTQTTMSGQTVYRCGQCGLYFYGDGSAVPLKALALVQAPEKTSYRTGDFVDLTGLSLQGTYANGTKVTLDADDVQNITADLSVPGRKTVQITVSGLTVEFGILVHDGRIVTVSPSYYPESAHNYSANLNETKTFTRAGSEQLIITFSEKTEVEKNYDFIYVYDGTGTLIAQFTGTEAAGACLIIPGDTFKITLSSDSIFQKYGYSFSTILADEGFIHPPVTVPGTATCTEGGLSDYIYCEICGEILQESVPVGPLGHQYANGACSICGETIPVPEEMLSYTIADGCATITGIKTSVSGRMVLPETVEGYPVTAIGKGAFAYNTDLTSVSLPSGVTSIGDSAFLYCTKLTSIKIPYGVTTIGKSAFDTCRGLLSMDLPATVKTIGESAFSDCISMETITMHSGITSIGPSAFSYCGKLASVTIPSTVTTLSEYVFSHCDSLTVVTIPNGVTSIGNHAFFGCDKLSQVTIPDSVSNIEDYAFYWCGSLTEVNIPSGVTSVGENAFAYCNSLTGIWVAAGNPQYTSDGKGVLYDKAKTTLIQAPGNLNGSYTIPSGVITVREYAFYNCSSLSELTIHATLSNVGRYAFSGCGALKTVWYFGTATQKDQIVIGAINDAITNKQWHLMSSCQYLDGGLYYVCADCNAQLPAVLQKLVLLNTPDDPFCVVGGSVDLQGLSLQATTDMGYTVTLGQESVATVTADLSAPGKTTVRIAVLGKTLGFPVYVHEKTRVTVDSSLYPESAHEYTNYLNETKTFTYPGATSLTVTFSPKTKVEANYDYLYVYDGNGTQLGKYTGTAAASLTLTIPGDTFRIKLTSDVRTTAYGYSFSSIVADTEEVYHPPVAVSDTVSCTQAGYAGRICCALCGQILEPGDELAALGHAWVGGSCTEPGTCARCGEEQGDAPGHSYQNSCCTVCGQIQSIPVELLSYRIEYGRVTITGLHSSAVGLLEIPATVEACPVTAIADGAFRDHQGLATLKLPSGITEIGENAFFGCGSLSGIFVSASNRYFSSDSNGVLYNKDKTSLLFVPASMTGSYVISDTVITIGEGAFAGCESLIALTVPSSVNQIGTSAFADCTGLTDIWYFGTATQKEQISIDGDNQTVTELHWHIMDDCRYQAGQLYYVCGDCDALLLTIPQKVTLAKAPDDPTCVVGGSVELAGLSIRVTTDRGDTCILGEDAVESFTADLSAPGKTTARVTVLGTALDYALYVHAGGTMLLDSALYPESDHDYANSLDKTDVFTYPGATSLTITFSSETKVENYYDYLYVYDGADNQLGKYTNTAAANLTLTVPGDTFKVRITSDFRTTAYGYSFAGILADMGEIYHPPVTVHGTANCTQSGRTEGVVCGLCGLLLSEPVASGPLGHSYVDGVCVACGDGIQGYYQLTQDMQVNGLSLEEDLYIDLNGYDVSGTIITNGYCVYGMDSSTDGYTCVCMGTFCCVDENGEEIVPVKQFVFSQDGATRRYMTVETDSGYTFHRFYLGITHISLAPSVTGFGYKAKFYADAMVQAEVDTLGYDLWLSEDTVVRRKTVGFRDQLSLRIRNFDAEQYGEAPVYARATMTLKDGTVIESATQSVTLRSAVETINSMYLQLTSAQLQAVTEMIRNHPIMKSWQIENID